MSQFRVRNINLGAMPSAAVGTDERPSPQSVRNQVPGHSGSNSEDGSGDAFRTYLESEDKKLQRVERQRADIHEILIFAALLAATVATLIGASIRGLQLDPFDKWAFYLAKTYELLADDKESQTFFPSATLVDPSKFSPPNSAILINSLWFLSLAVSLTCILLASLPQRLAHQHTLKALARSRTDPRHLLAAPRLLVGGEDDELQLPWLVDVLPTLLRISLFLFFAGFGVFVFSLTADYGTAQALLLTTGSLICPLLCFWHT